MRAISLLLLSVLLCPVNMAGLEGSGTGAKELFYDPLGERVTSALPQGKPGTPPAPATPPAKTPPVKSSSAKPSGSKSRRPAAQPVRRKVVPVSSPGSQKLLGLSYWIELVDPHGGPGQQVTDQRAFKSGERIRIHFRSNADGQIALLQMGASGDASLLFPNAAKGLPDSAITAGQDRILPSGSSWLRFDEKPGTERLLVVFARRQEDVDALPISPTMDPKATRTVLQTAESLRGSKDLLVETETQSASEVGTYGVTLSGKPVILEIMLKHE
jgi:hypothetical protein